jgi:hypothetical protein
MGNRKLDDDEGREENTPARNEESSEILLKRLYRLHRDKNELALSDRRRRFLDGCDFEPIGDAATRVVEKLSRRQP